VRGAAVSIIIILFITSATRIITTIVTKIITITVIL